MLGKSKRPTPPASSIPSQDDISQQYRKTFGQIKKSAYSNRRVILQHYLSDDGSVKRTAAIDIQCTKEPVKVFVWRVPLPTPESKLVALDLVRSHGINDYTISIEDGASTEGGSAMAVIHIHMDELPVGQWRHIEFSYSITNVCEIRNRFLFHKEYRYPFAYRPTSDTTSFEFRLHTLASANATIKSNLKKSEQFRLDDKRIIVSSEEPFDGGDVSGEVTFRDRTSSFIPIASLGLGLLSTVCIACIKYGEDALGIFYLPAILICAACIFFAAHRIYSQDT